MRCPGCGGELVGHAACPGCGTRLPAAGALPENAQKLPSEPWTLTARESYVLHYGISAQWARVGAFKAALAVAVAALALSACGGDEPAEQSTTATTQSPAVRLEKSFTSPRYDYTLRHPGDWSALRAVRSLGRDELVSYTSDSVDKLSKDPSGIQRPELTIGAQKLATGTSLDELRALTMQRIRNKGGCRPPAQTSTSVGGERATLLMYSPCGGLDLLWTVALHGKSGYHIVWWDAPEKAAAHRPLYEEILKSIAFKE